MYVCVPLAAVSSVQSDKGAAKLIKRFPNILGLSPETNLERKLTWLKDELQLSEQQVVAIATVSHQRSNLTTDCDVMNSGVLLEDSS